MAIKVGVTGGIGSGKSTVCKIFKTIGIPVFDADTTAKKLINTDTGIRKKMIAIFGENIYTKNNVINKQKLASLIFNNDKYLSEVNKIVHPVVRREFENWADKQSSEYVVHEAAIMFESGLYKIMDFTILVTAPEKQRTERVIKRDGVSVAEVRKRMQNQWSDKKKKELATIEIKNDNSELIIPQILRIDERIKRYGKIW